LDENDRKEVLHGITHELISCSDDEASAGPALDALAEGLADGLNEAMDSSEPFYPGHLMGRRGGRAISETSLDKTPTCAGHKLSVETWGGKTLHLNLLPGGDLLAKGFGDSDQLAAHFADETIAEDSHVSVADRQPVTVPRIAIFPDTAALLAPRVNVAEIDEALRETAQKYGLTADPLTYQPKVLPTQPGEPDIVIPHHTLQGVLRSNDSPENLGLVLQIRGDASVNGNTLGSSAQFAPIGGGEVLLLPVENGHVQRGHIAVTGALQHLDSAGPPLDQRFDVMPFHFSDDARTLADATMTLNKRLTTRLG
jgi:hypothetical protein